MLAVAFQVYRERGRPPFPRCPRDLRKRHESRELSRSNHAHVTSRQEGVRDERSALLGGGDAILGASSGSLSDDMDSLAMPGNARLSLAQRVRLEWRNMWTNIRPQRDVSASPRANYGTTQPHSPLINDNSNNMLVDPI